MLLQYCANLYMVMQIKLIVVVVVVVVDVVVPFMCAGSEGVRGGLTVFI